MKQNGSDFRDRRRQLRVLHVVPSFFPAVGYGGPVKALLDLCKAQVKAGLSVRVLTSDADGKARLRHLSNRWTRAYGVQTFYARVRVGEDFPPGLVYRLPCELLSADVVHVSGLWSPTSLLGLFLARCFQKKVVLAPHGALLPWALDSESGRGRQAKMRALRLLRPILDGVSGWHVSSQPEAEGVRALMRAGVLSDDAPIAQIEYGISLDEATVSDAGFPKKRPQILFLGRVHKVKNLELAMHALAKLLPSEPELQLLVAGPAQDAAYKTQLERLADSLHIRHAVTFCGLVGAEQKSDLFRTSKVLWLCSHMESFGMVVLEALLHGTPVVATLETPWDCLPQANVGEHVAARPEAFAQATGKYLHLSDAEQQALSQKCQRFVVENFAWSGLEKRLRDFYEQILKMPASIGASDGASDGAADEASARGAG